MERVTLICGACGAENLRFPKEEPKNQREAKQVHFICNGCGRKNLRDGSIPGLDLEEAEPQEEGEEAAREVALKSKPVKKWDEAVEDVLLLGGIGALILTIIKSLSGKK